jgi:hypothetical protein
MAQYTVTLSDAENKALGYYAASQEDWINNAVHERCRIAIDEIVKMEVEKKLAAGQTISGSKEDIVNAAELPVASESIPI